MKQTLTVLLLLAAIAGQGQSKPDRCPTGYETFIFDSVQPKNSYELTGRTIKDSADCWHAGGAIFWSPRDPFYIIEHRLDSLTHVIGLMHDSLIRLEKEIHDPLHFTPGEKWSDPGFWRPDTSWHLPPNSTYVGADTLFVRTAPFIEIQPSDYFLPADTIAIGAPKKKRRKG